jgi:hypothetical protein
MYYYNMDGCISFKTVFFDERSELSERSEIFNFCTPKKSDLCVCACFFVFLFLFRVCMCVCLRSTGQTAALISTKFEENKFVFST